MPEVILSDYFYGDESEEFIYWSIKSKNCIIVDAML